MAILDDPPSLPKHFGKEAGAALVFGILYFGMFCYMSFMYATKRYQWKSRFSILYFHCIIRVVSQACGVAFGVLVWSNIDVFIAYLILSAEGYFSLTIASFYFLKHYEIGHFGFSILGPAVAPKERAKRRTLEALVLVPFFMPWRYYKTEFIAIVDSWLIPANAIIIAGGSLMVGANNSQNGYTAEEAAKRLDTSKALRTTGQAIFLALTLVYVGLLLRLGRRIKAAHPPPRHANAAFTLFGIASAMLTARGIFGVLQAAIYSLSYYNFENYNGTGFTDRFIALEYCLTVVPEFVAAACLNCSFWTSRHLSTESPTHGSSLKDEPLQLTNSQYSNHESGTEMAYAGGGKA